MSRNHKAWWLNARWVMYALCVMLVGCFSSERDSQHAEKLFYEKKNLFLEMNAILMAHPSIYRMDINRSYRNNEKYGAFDADDENAYREVQRICSTLDIQSAIVSKESSSSPVLFIDYITNSAGLAISGYAVSVSYIVDDDSLRWLKSLGVSIKSLTEKNWYVTIYES